MLKKIMLIVILILIVVPAVFIGVGALISAPSYKGQASDHFDGKKFINPGGVIAKGPGEVLKWMLNRQRGPWTGGAKLH